jgi:UDP-N-acetylmuramoyl-tripeptide--D-alanyl-D-alanine ligase
MDGALFVALVGEYFDAHDYIQQAQEMGAVAKIRGH